MDLLTIILGGYFVSSLANSWESNSCDDGDFDDCDEFDDYDDCDEFDEYCD